jgi:hypothetical protein
LVVRKSNADIRLESPALDQVNQPAQLIAGGPELVAGFPGI